MLGRNKSPIIEALTYAFVNGNALLIYRQALNTMNRKSWAAGDSAAQS